MKDDHATSAPILADAVYPLAAFKAATKLDDWAMREARKAGLKVRRVGRRAYIVGADWIEFLKSPTGPLEAPAADRSSTIAGH
jgi:hypothetical protein